MDEGPRDVIETLPLRRVARLVNGGTPSSDEAYWGGDIPWATPIDLARIDGGYVSATDRNLTPAGLRQGSATVPAGSLLLSTRAPIGYVALAAGTIAFNQGCKGLVPAPGTDGRFLRYWLTASRANLQAAGSGSTFMELGGEALMSFPVPAQSPVEQRRIADFLDDQVVRIDNIIAARTRQIESLAHLAIAFADEAVSDPSAPMRRIAPLLELGAVGVVVNPSTYFVDDGVPFVHGYNVRDGFFDLSDLKRMTEQDSISLSRSRLRVGDVLVVRAGYPGRAAVVTEELVGGNCASVLLLRPGSAVLPGWIEAFFNSRLGKQEVAKVQYGAAQGVINLADVKSFAIPLPPLVTQRARLASLEDRRRQVASWMRSLANSLALLNELKPSLITAAVTGEFDVSSADGSRVSA